MKKLVLIVNALVLIAALVLAACSAASPGSPPQPPAPRTQSREAAPGAPAAPPGYQPPVSVPVVPPAPAPPGLTAPEKLGPPGPSGPPGPEIGLAAGGAKDIRNFRENVRNKFLPLPTDITYEGLFYDYFFDTGPADPSDKLYYPSYGYAVTRDPFSRRTEYYLSVGLNSGMKESDFRRKKLNLAIVLDNSGSMSGDFNRYYYDGTGRQVDAWGGEGIHRQRKMDSANQAVAAILDQLNSDDRFSIVLFNSNAYMLKSMGAVNRVNMRSVKNSVFDVIAGGSTNLEAGIEMGTAELRGLRELNNYEYENRMIILTDAQPNTADFTAAGLLRLLRRNADSRIYTTVIGIGVDFNTQLIEDITKIRGANYYAVHSAGQFRQRVEEEFEFMVTPLVFNLRLNFESRGWRIEKVFGSPEANEATGELMKINTLFPSKRIDGETRGGLVLLKLRKTSSSPEERVYLRVSYEDRNGRRDSSEAVIYLEAEQPEFFSHSGIRKGVLLSRYASLLKNWMIDERQNQGARSWTASIREDTGILIPSGPFVSQWERQSLSLVVSEPYRRIFRDFARYFEDEMRAIGDSSLDQELRLLTTLTRRG